MMKIDLHVHTSEISRCAHLTAEETIARYRNAGYDAIVITNHFNRSTAEYFARQGIPDFTGCFFSAVRSAEEIGKKYGLTIFPGMEILFDGSGNDYLVYGMPESAVKDFDSVFRMGPAEFSKMAVSEKALLYQAHPFRQGMTIVNPEYLFGMEVMNGNPRHDSRNDIAVQWARKFHLHQIGGSDCHRIEDIGSAGIITEQPVESIENLIQVLQDDAYKIFCSESAQPEIF